MRYIVFDTETTGVKAAFSYILSLSWQVLGDNLETIDEQTRYFENPVPEERCQRALEVNKLTNKRLAELGTSDKKESLKEFADTVMGCDWLVAHNASFDIGFIDYEMLREDISERKAIFKKPCFDTMKRMTEYCSDALGGKWPRLSELAECLSVDTSDIDWHHSASDVEVTARCFRRIVNEKICKL